MSLSSPGKLFRCSSRRPTIKEASAAPPEGLGVKSVTQPLYRGFCVHNDTLEASRQKYLSREQDIMAVLDSDARLEERSKKKAVRMLDRYFDVLKDDKDFNRHVIEKCRS